MAEPEPGLLPIIPPFPPQAGPSPLIPVIVLLIVGILRWALLRMLDVWSSFGTSTYDWSMGIDIDSIRSHFTITALLIPLCLVLAIHAFGIPQVNPVRNAPPPSPFVSAITQNFWSSIFLVIVITALLLSLPIRSIVHSPWRPESSPISAYAIPGSGARGQVRNGVCQELGILKRRCENWKGNSRDSVCRELARLQKRCERSKF